jgi:hypothetical protein
LAVTAAAQDSPPIQDNSFFIEEAYNQERGVVQHIYTFQRFRDGGGRARSFTQEWPAPGQRHQLSYTLAYLATGGADGPRGRGPGDLALNYRYQLLGGEGETLWVAPRVSFLVPTGDEEKGLGAGAAGLQVNLPVSVELARDWTGHFNAGATFIPSAKNAAGAEADTATYNLGASLIFAATPRLNFMLEWIWSRAEIVVGPDSLDREVTVFVSPGIRWAHNFRNGLQIVPGIAYPIEVRDVDREEAVFLYVSFEHPFRRD